MKKYNRTAIFRKMWGLVKNYKMDASTALTKAWKMEKLELAERELAELNMKELNGGKHNIVAQNMIRENNARIAELIKEINGLKAEIYPTVECVQEERIDPLRRSKVNSYAVVFGEHSSSYINAKKELDELIAKGTETRIVEKLDLNAYDAA